MTKTIKNKVYTKVDGIWTGIDKNKKVFKVTVKSLLEELNKEDDSTLLKTENIVTKETFTPLVGEWVDDKTIEIKEDFQTETEDSDVDMSGVKETKKESTGLGDTVAKITSMLGIEPCEACNKRKEKLNKYFPYLSKDVRELTEQEKTMFDEATVEKDVIKGKYVKSMFILYNDLFSTKLQPCRCPGLLKKIVERLKVARGE